MPRKRLKGPSLQVAMQFNWEGSKPSWTWEIVVPRRYSIRSAGDYTTRQAAKKVGRRTAEQLGVELAN